jgi:hypothetical protein
MLSAEIKMILLNDVDEIIQLPENNARKTFPLQKRTTVIPLAGHAYPMGHARVIPLMGTRG